MAPHGRKGGRLGQTRGGNFPRLPTARLEQVEEISLVAMSNADNERNRTGCGPWGRPLLARGAQSRCECGRGELSPGSDVAG